jgi:hypothetical protein
MHVKISEEDSPEGIGVGTARFIGNGKFTHADEKPAQNERDRGSGHEGSLQSRRSTPAGRDR